VRVVPGDALDGPMVGLVDPGADEVGVWPGPVVGWVDDEGWVDGLDEGFAGWATGVTPGFAWAV
jgi:hypothetical protein